MPIAARNPYQIILSKRLPLYPKVQDLQKWDVLGARISLLWDKNSDSKLFVKGGCSTHLVLPFMENSAVFKRLSSFLLCSLFYSIVFIMSASAKPSLQKEKGEVVSLKHWKVKFIWSVAQMQGHSAGKIQVHNKFHLSVSIQKTPTKGKKRSLDLQM